jgi:hypothetical protein
MGEIYTSALIKYFPMLKLLKLNKYEAFFLLFIYLLSLYLRLAPRLEIDPHLLTFQGDIWYRLTMAQYILDNQALPDPDIRYLAYGYVPMWYPPLSPIFFALASYITGLDIPTVSSRLVPFLEALTPLSIYFLARYLYSQRVAIIAALALALTPTFIFWSGISDPQSFTFFIIPLAVLFWVHHSRAKPSNKRLLFLGVVLAFTFLLHLSYFVVVMVLFTTTLALVIKREGRPKLLLDFGKVFLISQVLTLPWWLPENLYWWWVKALVTSSGLYTVEDQLADYGVLTAFLGITAFIYIASKGRKHLLLILWALPLLLESQNEAILAALGRSDLAWSTLAKPLEGFRFYPFLAQPLSIAIGVLLVDAADKVKTRIFPVLALLLLLGLLGNVKLYGLDDKFQTSGLITEEYEAAKWYREHSLPEDRIIADYYRAQMFAGVAGGKALLGGMFPLRNVDYPYIKAPGVVQNDLYVLYKTKDARKAANIARKYNATHIFYSGNMISYGNLLSYYKNAREFGVDIDREKFYDEGYFERIYYQESPYSEVVIVRVK